MPPAILDNVSPIPFIDFIPFLISFALFLDVPEISSTTVFPISPNISDKRYNNPLLPVKFSFILGIISVHIFTVL